MQSRADFRDIILPEILGLLYIVSGNATITFEKLCEQCSKKLEKMGQWKDAEEAGKAPCLPHPGCLRSAPFCPSLYEVAPKRWGSSATQQTVKEEPETPGATTDKERAEEAGQRAASAPQALDSDMPWPPAWLTVRVRDSP